MCIVVGTISWLIHRLGRFLLDIFRHITGRWRTSFHTIGVESTHYNANSDDTVSRGRSLLVFIPGVNDQFQHHDRKPSKGDAVLPLRLLSVPSGLLLQHVPVCETGQIQALLTV